MANDNTLYPAQFNRRISAGSGTGNINKPELCRLSRAVNVDVRRLVILSTEEVESVTLLD